MTAITHTPLRSTANFGRDLKYLARARMVGILPNGDPLWLYEPVPEPPGFSTMSPPEQRAALAEAERRDG